VLGGFIEMGAPNVYGGQDGTMADNLRTELLGIRRAHLAELRALRAMLINNKAKVTHILDQVRRHDRGRR
jgi:hypothetical protein